MKKLIILFTVILISCGPTKEEMTKSQPSQYLINNYSGLSKIILDSCEYFMYTDGHSAALIHKPKCKNH